MEREWRGVNLAWSALICLCSRLAVGMAVVQLQRMRVADSRKSTPANPMYMYQEAEYLFPSPLFFHLSIASFSFLLPIVLSFARGE